MQLKNLTISDINIAFIIGVLSSAIVGVLSIGFLLRHLTTRSFDIFVWYRLIIGLAIIVLVFVRM